MHLSPTSKLGYLSFKSKIKLSVLVFALLKYFFWLLKVLFINHVYEEHMVLSDDNFPKNLT